MNDGGGITKENLLSAFPIAIRETDGLAALGDVTAEVLAERPPEIAALSLYPRIRELPEDLLDILAYDFKVDWWDPGYSLEEKRQTMSDSWRVHKMLGTRKAVETAIRAIYPKTDVKEWFEYEGGKPYHFKLYIDLSGETWSAERPRRVLERVEFYKSLRSHLEEFQFTSKPTKGPAVLHLGGQISAVACIPIPEKRDDFDFGSMLRLGGRTELCASFPLPEKRDDFDFGSTLRLGGRTEMGTSFPLPEKQDSFDLRSKLRLGGDGGLKAEVPVPQEQDRLRMEGKLRAGGQPAVRTVIPIPEA